MGSCMVYKVMQDIASMGAASCGGATQEQRPVGRPWTKHVHAGAAQPTPMAPWTDGVLGFV